MQILEVVLYSHDGAKRTVEFKLGKVNIISGISATGKSSILEIIDYCLGRDKCDIASGPVRASVDWYGLLLQFHNDRVFIARQAPPKGSDYSSSMHIDSGPNLKSPPGPPEHTNSNFNAIVKTLGKKIGISPYLHIPEKGRTRSSLSATLRHAIVFCFQKQYEITSKKTLFHGQESGFISESIEDTLEYFLGAIREDSLTIQQNLILAKRNVKRRERELQEAEEIRGEGVSRAIGIVAKAKELGLISEEKPLRKFEDYVLALQKLSKWNPKDIPSTKSSYKDLTQNDMAKLKKELRDLDEKIQVTKAFADEFKGYTDELKHQERRLESIGLYDNTISQNKCPICSSKIDHTPPTIKDLKNSLKALKTELENVPKIKPRLRETIYELEEEKQKLIQKIDEKHETLSKLVEQEERLEKIKNENMMIGEVLGTAKFWLENVDLSDETSPLRKALSRAQNKVKELDSQINQEIIDARMRRILTKINAKLTEWAIKLRLEHCGDPVIFDPHNLTVHVQNPEEDIPLSRMGSAQNWLGYHTIVNLALHDYFINNNRPVPRFLLLDQPSQVYFPAELPMDESGTIDNLSDPDREAIGRFFNFLFEFEKMHKNEFQIIVTDHVKLTNDKEFMSRLREDWRNGKKLIPSDWYS